MELLTWSLWSTSASAWCGAALWLLSFRARCRGPWDHPGEPEALVCDGMATADLRAAVPRPCPVLLLGGTAVGKKRDIKQIEASARIRDRAAGVSAQLSDHVGPGYVQSVATLNRSLGAVPALQGNAAELYSDYGESIAAMTSDVGQAERFVHVQFYITAWDVVTHRSSRRW
jgi:hypothetical protein